MGRSDWYGEGTRPARHAREELVAALDLLEVGVSADELCVLHSYMCIYQHFPRRVLRPHNKQPSRASVRHTACGCGQMSMSQRVPMRRRQCTRRCHR